MDERGSIDERGRMSEAAAGYGVRLARFAGWLAGIERAVSVVLLSIVVGCLSAQVIARYVFGSPISWSEEVARLGLIWLTFIASGFVTARGQHLTVDLLPAGVSHGVRRRLDQVAGAVVLLTCVTLLIGGFRFVWRVWPVASPGIGVSMSFWYASASFGLALMAFHTAVGLLGCESTERAGGSPNGSSKGSPNGSLNGSSNGSPNGSSRASSSGEPSTSGRETT